MPANDHLGDQFDPPGPVYHGSPHGFAPGDVIAPHKDQVHLEEGDAAAFGTTFPTSAGYFALEANRREVQPRLFTSVYEVEPMSEYDLHPSARESYDSQVEFSKNHDLSMPEKPVNNMPVDRKGFRVKRHAAFAFPDLDAERHGRPYVREKLQETPGGG